MKKSLPHLPKLKQSELMLITEKIREIEFVNFKLRAYPNNQVVMRPSEKFQANPAGPAG